MDDRASEKKDRLLTALERGLVMVHLDARRPGVLVPPELRCESHLRLHLSYKFVPPDLTVGEWGIRSTLSFSGHRFTVALPWSALFAITSKVTHEFWMFPEDMPTELTQIPPPRLRAAATARPPLEARRVALREVDGERKSGTAEGDEAPRGRAHLKLIKS
ncbi:MAG TPA: ClpXP protease specificity-enhancing factor SspB [Myxococcaceae bacterium]|nr:ClpXP protease specificity-enhancing factor SspB [Myxococcaceae bacterium]